MNFTHYYIQSHLLQMGFSAAQKSNCISLVRLLPLLQSENFVTSALFSNFQHLCLGPALRANLPLLPYSSHFYPPACLWSDALCGPTSANTSTCGQISPPLLKDVPPTAIGTKTAAIALLLKQKTTFLSSRFSTCPISLPPFAERLLKRAVCLHWHI